MIMPQIKTIVVSRSTGFGDRKKKCLDTDPDSSRWATLLELCHGSGLEFTYL